MKQYGYDKESGALFSWDNGLRFEGLSLTPPEGAFISDNQIDDEMAGCSFLMGRTGSFLILRSDGDIDTDSWGLYSYDLRRGMWKGRNIGQDNFWKLAQKLAIGVCGKIVMSPEKLSCFCNRFPNSRVYACPLVNELAAFGALMRNVHDMPYRIALAWDNKEPIDAESVLYDPALEGDAMGRMADVVSRRIPVVNEVMTTVGISPFYGKTLHRGTSGDCVMVRISEMDTFFPAVPISAKFYAATSVPVQMAVTKQFADRTGYNDSFVNVFVATDYVPGVCAFMTFFKLAIGGGFISMSDQKKIQHKGMVPVFRGDRAYRVPREKYEQARGFIQGS